MTQPQASARADQEPPGAGARTANRASGASPAAGPVSATATQTSATPKAGNAEAAGTARQDASATGEDEPALRCPRPVRFVNKRLPRWFQVRGRVLWEPGAWLRGPLPPLSLSWCPWFEPF